MKKTILIATVLVVMFPLIAFAQNEGYYSGSYTRMSYVKGDVYIQRGQDLGYEQGEVNLVVAQGDKIGTKDGRVEIQLGRRNYLRLDDYAQVDIVNLPRSDNDPIKLHLLSGSIYVRINSLNREKNFEIHTPDASFYILEEGLYRIDVRENRETEFSVISGSAEAAGEEGSVLVRSREQILAANGRFTSEPVSFYLRRDDFGDWNEIRDALYAQRVNRTYLPAEYSDYEYELADNGSWVYESSYGYVWVPTVAYSDWRPYYSGHWSWYPIIGWTWISSEPWGWCTHHFGRWGWRGGLGWYWIPTRSWYWGPAWVHWYWDFDFIGWCPLSYYNYPAVIINNRFYDRYAHQLFPNNSRSLTMVHKNQLQHPRVAQVALDQTRINKIGNISLKSRQPELRPTLNHSGEIATKAQRVLSRENLRSVGKSFTPGGKRLTSEELKSPAIKRSSAPETSTIERRNSRNQLSGTDSERTVRKDNSRIVSRSSSQKGDVASTDQGQKKSVVQDYLKSRLEGEAGRSVQRYPSRKSFENESPKSNERPAAVSPSLRKEAKSYNPSSSEKAGPELRPQDTGRTIVRRSENVDDGKRTSNEGKSLKEFQSRIPESGAPRNSVSEKTIKERGRSDEGASSAPKESLPQKREKGVTRTYEPQSRSIVRNDAFSRSPERAPARSSETPSRVVSSSPRRIKTPPQSSNSPSRSYSAPSRSYSAPLRSSSAPSRNYGSSSSSSGSLSRSFNSPSRSSSSSSSSGSSPLRSSSSSSSRSSSSSSSSSSGSGGRVKIKD